jgi:MYXO-CTERM domain-containing protein
MVGLLGLLLAIGVARADEPPDPVPGESGCKCASEASTPASGLALLAAAALTVAGRRR